jgi:hypothetical protein
MYQQLKRQNFLVLSHFGRVAFKQFMQIPVTPTVGSSRGMFAQMIKVGID